MRWRDLLRRDRDDDVDAEIEAHLRMAIADRIARGESPAEARRAVLREFGNVRAVREDARAVWRWTEVEQLAHDLRSGARILRTAPALSVTAILLIALVIGGNTAIYSIAHGLLTRPAPGVEPAGLAAIGWLNERGNAGPGTSYPVFRDLAAGVESLQLAAFRIEALTLVHEGGAHAVRGVAASPGYFDALGVRFAHGRPFLSGADASGGLEAVISHAAWLRLFEGAADAVGRAITVDGQPAIVVGITASPFQGFWTADASDLWIPLEPYARAEGAGTLDDRTVESTNIVARLHRGRTLREAESELRTAFAALPEAAADRASRKTPVLHRYTGIAARNNVLAERGPRFLAIFSVVTLLTLVIVSANVANLMLGRAVSRQRELAVRQSFGATRGRILRLVVAEGSTIAVVAWGLACVLAYWLSQLLPRLIPASSNGGAAFVLDVTPDPQVLAYAMLLAVAGTLCFSAAPAVRTWRQDLLPYLRAGEQGASHGGSSLSQALVAVQLAFSVILLVAAGLGYRSLALIDSTSLGFDSRGMLLLTLDTSDRARTAEANVRLLDAIADRLRTVPGVAAASYARRPPSGVWPQVAVRTDPAAPPLMVETNRIGAGYLAVHALQPVAGRGFTADTPRGATPRALVNRTLADRLFPAGDAIGGRMLVGAELRPATVAGVVPDALFGGFRRNSRPDFLLIDAADEPIGPGPGVTVYVRSAGTIPPLTTLGAAITEVDPHVPIVYARSIDTELNEITWAYRTLTVLLMAFAGASLTIAALGQYAAVSFALRRRVRELGIRIALGANRSRIVSDEIQNGLRLTAAGLAAGLLFGVLAARATRALLIGVTPTDAPTLLGVATLLGATSMLACYLPARRAAAVDPVAVLKQE